MICKEPQTVMYSLYVKYSVRNLRRCYIGNDLSRFNCRNLIQTCELYIIIARKEFKLVQWVIPPSNGDIHQKADMRWCYLESSQ